MKHISIFIVAFILLLTNCGKDKDDNKEINLYICGEENPEWVLNKIDSITNKTSNHIPIAVYSANINSIEYIAIINWTSSSMADGHMFFLCSGEQIEFDSKKYKELWLLYYEEDTFKLIWSNSKLYF